METSAEPVSPNERILTLDVIRGFALLGIFLLNARFASPCLRPASPTHSGA